MENYIIYVSSTVLRIVLILLPKSIKTLLKFAEICLHLHSQCGLLSIDAFPLKAAKKVKSNLDKVGIPSHLVEATEFREKYPMLKYGDGAGAVLEKEAGVLMASKCLKVYQVYLI